MLDKNSPEEQLKSARKETERLRAMLWIPDLAVEKGSPPEVNAVENPNSRAIEGLTQERKVALFRSLFRGREDVYAVRWEGKSGKSGYSPAGVMDWRAIHAARPEERKKGSRKTRTLQPLPDSAIRDHLTGKQTVGVYPLLPDETCWFLAVD